MNAAAEGAAKNLALDLDAVEFTCEMPLLGAIRLAAEQGGETVSGDMPVPPDRLRRTGGSVQETLYLDLPSTAGAAKLTIAGTAAEGGEAVFELKTHLTPRGGHPRAPFNLPVFAAAHRKIGRLTFAVRTLDRDSAARERRARWSERDSMSFAFAMGARAGRTLYYSRAFWDRL